MARPTMHDPILEARLARRLFSAAFMSDTKWRKALRAMEQAGLGIREMLVKFIDLEEPRRIRFPPSLACPRAYMDTIEFGPTALRSIEWLEVGADVEQVLSASARFPITVTGGRSRIWGYGE